MPFPSKPYLHIVLAGSLLLMSEAVPAQPVLSTQESADIALEAAQAAADQVLELVRAGRTTEAISLAERALPVLERERGRDDPDTIAVVNVLGLLYQSEDRYVEAERYLRRAVDDSARALGPEHAGMIVPLKQLGSLYRLQGQLDAAEPLLRRALNLGLRHRLAGSRDLLSVMSELGIIYRDQGRHAEAEPLLRRVLGDFERLDGRDGDGALTAANELALLYRDLGRYADAELLLRRSLEASERIAGADDAATLTYANNLGLLLRDLGRYAEAEPLLSRSVEASSRLLGPTHGNTLSSTTNLGLLYWAQRRYAEAELLMRRSLEAREQVFGSDNVATIIASNNLANLLAETGRETEAEAMLRRAVAVSERVAGPDHQATLTSMNNLAFLLTLAARHQESEALFRRVAERRERVLGQEHPDTLVSRANLGLALERTGRLEQAAALYRQTLEPNERIFGRLHPSTLATLAGYVGIAAGRPAPDPQLLPAARRLLAALRDQRQQGTAGERARIQQEREASTTAFDFTLFADAAWASTGNSAQRDQLLPEVFAALQDSIAGPASRAVAEQAARRIATSRDPALGALIRERLTLQARWAQLDDELVDNVVSGPGRSLQGASQLRAELERLQARIAMIDGRLRAESPEYFNLVQPTPLTPERARALLGPDEAILMTVPGRLGTHIVVVTRERFLWHRSDWDIFRIREAVHRLRWNAGARVDAAPEELERLRRSDPPDGSLSFDRATALALYQGIIRPVLPVLAGKQRLFVAAGGPLAGLPFALLVSQPPIGSDRDPAALRGTRWFGDDFLLLHIPSIQALSILRAERGAGRRSRGPAFIGIGNPRLGPAAPRRSLATRSGTTSARRIFAQGRTRNGSPADIRQLRQMPSLPGTAEELRMVRAALEAPSSSVLEGSRATEPNVRSINFTNAGLVLFSTHGLTSQEADGAGEPGLVLTPPDEELNYSEVDPRNDGYLAASEVTGLRMDAEWVVLSACNTATGDDEANLSALARAFFFAGARNVLASHWPVADEVAPQLITRTVSPTGQRLTRGQALQAATRSIREDPDHPERAHPFFWAPFILIGDDG